MSGVLKQYLATITCNILAASYGSACAWAGPNFLVLTADDTPIASGPLSTSEAALVVSIPCFGAIIACLLYSLAIDRFSRRVHLISIALPLLISWVILLLATNVYHLYVARFLVGFSGGGLFIVIPVYVSEIAEPKVRGTLGSMMILICNSGILLGFILASYLDYFGQIKANILLPTLFFLFFNFFPETPEWLLKRNQKIAAEKSRNFYRGLNNPPSYEMKQVDEKEKTYEKVVNDESIDDGLSLSDFFTPAAKKAILIGVVIGSLNQLCGNFAMINYTNKIFAEAGSTLSGSAASVIVAIVQLSANASAVILVDRAGRKLLMTASAFATGLGLISMGLYDMYKESLMEHRWIPIAAFSMIIFFSSVGMLPLTYVILSELLPRKIKNIIILLAIECMWCLAFGLVSFYPILTETFGTSMCMFFFATCCMLGALFYMTVLPETKGKTYEEVMEALAKLNASFSAKKIGCAEASTTHRVKMPSVLKQYLATITCNILAIAYGSSCAWAGPNFLVLTTNDTPIESGPLSTSEAAMVVAIPCFGAIISTLFYSLVIDRFSRRVHLISIAIPLLLSWVILLLATNVYHLYAARFIGGFSGGGALIVIPIFITEIAEDEVRGTLGSMIILFCNTGVLTGFVLASYLDYFGQIKANIMLPTLFLLLFNFFPETPEWLLKRNQKIAAEKSRNFYRGLNNPPSYEMKQIDEKEKTYEKVVNDESIDDGLSFSDFCTPAAKRAIIISLVIGSLNTLCGSFVMINYTNKIFAEAGSTLSGSAASIVVALVMLSANFLAMVLVDRAGRKLLMTASAFATSLSLISMGLYDMFKESLMEHRWIPIVAFSMIIFFSSVGMLPLTCVILSEILPKKIKNIIILLALECMWGLAFALISFYPILTETFGTSTCVFFFATCCMLGAIFYLTVLPETKAKTYEEIIQALAK
ncbi:uncharacterized protein LOC129564928 [Sitodiplosis mosellana]|uniref:uncharacterized protein LOC129564928 n=1 Tax=Sitodiplosis mosellana TaxID=263140 RepID=UPI002444C19D|nr:uncharacterized protein LOC129564928 [Sitodiplosis mosellana]